MSNIKAGDLVIETRPFKCCGRGNLGKIGRVIEVKKKIFRCGGCGKLHYQTLALLDHSKAAGTEIYRPTKIDPPSTEDQITREVEVKA